MDYQTFKDMDLSRDEVERLTNAFKDNQFKKLFFDYVDELQDPENRRIYQKEIAQLEKERGVDVTFINPEPGYVVKTSVGGEKKCFLNVCCNENVRKPSSSVGVKEGARGLQWSLPHSLSPVREDVDRKGVRCDVYDVVFHPDTLHLAQNNKAFRNMLNSTACEAVESNFNVTLDKKNLKFPKMQYKGAPHATVIRKPSKDGPVEREAGEQEVFDRIYAAASSSSSATSAASGNKQEKKKSSKKAKHEEVSVYGNYTRPNFLIKHRDCVDMQDFREAKDAKIHAATPRELVLEVDLPLLKASTDITLDVTEKTVHLLSEKPAKYKLEVTLPYEVNQDAGSAKFDKDKKKLVIVLPVKRKEYCFPEDSGVESDHGSISTSPSEELAVQSEFRTNSVEFLDVNLVYSLPDFTCHVFENNIAFTLNVKNVSEETIEKLFKEENKAIHVKFASVGASFFPAHYAFYLKLPEHTIDVENVAVEAWDNNVVVQFPFKPSEKIVSQYLVGVCESDAVEKFVEQPQILNVVLQEEEKEEEKQEQKTIIPDEKQAATTTTAIDIVSNNHNYSESSGDELSCSYSPTKSRGILKRLNGRQVIRSISESSLDDMIVVSSFENNHHASFDSMIPEEDGEVSSSLKKTVRFNDHVSKQLYRSNASILGQKKKNQRKKSNKKRAQERRCSESEASEGEEKKEEDKTSSTEQSEESSDVFELDMY